MKRLLQAFVCAGMVTIAPIARVAALAPVLHTTIGITAAHADPYDCDASYLPCDGSTLDQINPDDPEYAIPDDPDDPYWYAPGEDVPDPWDPIYAEPLDEPSDCWSDGANWYC